MLEDQTYFYLRSRHLRSASSDSFIFRSHFESRYANSELAKVMLRSSSHTWQQCLQLGPLSTSRARVNAIYKVAPLLDEIKAKSITTYAPLYFTTSRLNRGPSPPTPPAFPCVDANEARNTRLLASQGPLIDAPAENDADSEGPEPNYTNVVSGYKVYHHDRPFLLDYGGELSKFNIAYETWGQLNADKSNVILVHTGLSASSHAASHSDNTAAGWWESFIGPGKALDTNKYFVICTNVLGSCYGSTGPSSRHPLDPDGAPYATRFPILSIFDMVRAQFHLLDHLGIQNLYASLGSSMGGMQSVAAAHLYPDRVKRLVSISGCARSAPASIALRFAQRSGEYSASEGP